MTHFRGASVIGVLQAFTMALVLAFAAPQAARAEVFTIDSGALVYDIGDADLYGTASNGNPMEDVFLVVQPFTITGSVGSTFEPGNAQSFLAFCLNPFVDAPIGGPGLDLPFFDGAIPPDLVTQITALVDYGYGLYNSGDLNAVKFQLGAVQGAIWQVLFPDFTFTGLYDMGSGTFAEPLTSLIAAYAAPGGVPGASSGLTLRVLETERGSFQNLAILVDGGGVPEPGVWGLMIVGFFGTGVLIRRRRTALAA